MSLFKALDSISHDLLIALLEVSGFDRNSFTFVYSDLTGRIQKVNVGSSNIQIGKKKKGVPLGLVLGLMLLNILTNDLLKMGLESDIYNFADGNTIYTRGNILEEVIIDIEDDPCTFYNGLLITGHF